MKLLARSEFQGPKLVEFGQRFSSIPTQLRTSDYLTAIVPPALEERTLSLPMPFATEFWTAESDSGELLGRVSANLSYRVKENGFIGFFEAKDFGTARALMSQALGWLKSKGAQTAFGPVNFNTWLPYRLRIKQKANDPSYSWEPCNPPEYPLWFEELGFEPASYYHTDGLDGLEGILSGTEKDFKRSQELGYTIRSLNNEKLLDQEVPILHKISMEAFQKNFLFEEIPMEFFRELYVPLANKADLSLARIACDPKGKPVAFFFNFQQGEYFVAKSVGVIPEARGKGLSNAALYSAVKDAVSRGLNKSIMALMQSGIQSESYGKKQGQLWRHDYVLFKKGV